MERPCLYESSVLVPALPQLGSFALCGAQSFVSKRGMQRRLGRNLPRCLAVEDCILNGAPRSRFRHVLLNSLRKHSFKKSIDLGGTLPSRLRKEGKAIGGFTEGASLSLVKQSAPFNYIPKHCFLSEFSKGQHEISL